MRHYLARELKLDGQPSGLWHYTVEWQRSIEPAGACANDCPGHPTSEAAYEHERQRQLESARVVRFENWAGCQVDGCEAPTRGGYQIPGHAAGIYPLCSAHRTREDLATLHRVGEGWAS